MSFSNARQNELLRTFGLQRLDTTRRMSVLSSVAMLGVGLAVGASVALLFAPKTGRELRDDLGRRATRLTETARNAVPKRDSEWTAPNVSTSS